MELKDMILSTLAEMDETDSKQEKMSFASSENENKTSDKKVQKEHTVEDMKITNEADFLSSVRERVLVLFEGLQSPKNQNLDVKMDITLNFLEFLLSLIEDRLKAINSKKK